MAFTAKFGISDSKFSNEVFGLGATILPYRKFSGLYTLVPGKTDDTLFLDISYPEFSTIDIAIPNPFVETGLIGEADDNSPLKGMTNG